MINDTSESLDIIIIISQSSLEDGMLEAAVTYVLQAS